MSVKSRVSKNKSKSKKSRMETIPEENDFHSALEENSISKYFDSQDSVVVQPFLLIIDLR